MEQNEIHLSFNVWNFNDITHADISDALKLLPHKALVKGESRNPKNTKPNSPKIKENGWLLDSNLGNYAPFEDQMNNLLDVLEPRIEILKPICLKYDCEFSCALYVYRDNGESTPWVHLDGRYNKFIKEVNVEFDLDLYVL